MTSQPFALRKAMRERLKAARKAGVIAFIDIGSNKIACFLTRLEPIQGGEPRLRLLGAGLTRARGVKLGAVTDLAESAKAIRAAVSQAEQEAGVRAFHTIANLTGAHPRSHAVRSEIDVTGPRIGPRDMQKAMEACSMPPESDDRAILHAIAVNWSVNGENGVRDPNGLAGRKLALDLHVLTIAEDAARNLAHCLASADLELSSLIATPFASGLSCLTEAERMDGAACIDIGGGCTAISMFLKGDMVFADLVRVGGAQITLDVMRRLDVSNNDAERLKTLEGSAAPMSNAAGESVSLPRDHTSSRDGARLTRADLSAAIRPRVDEMLELARDRLAQAGYFHLPSPRVAITGGGAQLDGLISAAQAVFGAQVRIGRPERPPGLPAAYAGPAYSTLAGLCEYIDIPPERFWDHAPETAKPTKGVIGGLFQWVRDTW